MDRNVQTSVLSEVGLHVLVRNDLKNEAERHELQPIRLTGIVLKSSSESITMFCHTETGGQNRYFT